MKKLLALVLMLTFVLVLYGCKDKVDLTPTGIVITGQKEVSVGGEIQLTAKVAPEGSVQTVTWSSGNAATAAVDSTGKVTGVSVGGVIIYAKSTVNDKQAQYAIQVKPGDGIVYPDLGGYTIKIAHSVAAESDPFHDDYIQSDKEARKQAWGEVEDLYNVKFVVERFDESYAWGPPRWQYLIDQASANTSDYDFVSVPDDKIGLLVEGNALHDVSSWYSAYGKGFLDATYRSSGTYKGKLYSIIDGAAGINNVMYYNANLVSRLIDEGHLQQTPAELFNEGNWTYDAFVTYAIAAQNGLKSIFPTEEDVYAVSGNTMYYWVGMANAGGVGLTNPSNLTVHFTDAIPEDAALHLKEIADANAMRPDRTVDGVAFAAMHNSFTKGFGVFDTGDMWFIGSDVRWPSDMWGEGDLTKYGYVPFPRPNDTLKDSHQIAMGGTATYAMPIGREADYAGFGEASTENVYRAFTHTFLLTQELRQNDPDYDPQAARQAYADRMAHTPDSKEALLWVYDRVKTHAFFDPWSLPTNPVGNTYGDAIGSEFHNYITSAPTGKATFIEAVGPHVARLQEALTKAYS